MTEPAPGIEPGTLPSVTPDNHHAGGHMRRHVAAGLLLLATATATACGGEPPNDRLDDNARAACTYLIGDYTDALTETERADIARKIQRQTEASTVPGIPEAGDRIVAARAGTDTEWTHAGDVLAKLCLDNGYGD